MDEDDFSELYERILAELWFQKNRIDDISIESRLDMFLDKYYTLDERVEFFLEYTQRIVEHHISKTFK